ncbi:hypothetical protein Kpol_1002p123, partial [Vanderwaltozyma polyspora DSM 70294]
SLLNNANNNQNNNNNTTSASMASNHRNLENFVAPSLDASCSIVNDENTSLTDVDMVIPSRTPSTIGLDLALGRTRSYSNSPILSTSPLSPSDLAKNNGINNNYLRTTRSYSYSNQNIANSPNSPITSPEFSKVLKFYSYADVLTDELSDNTLPITPPISSTSPIPLRNNNAQSQQRNLAHPSVIRRDSAPPNFQHQLKKHPNSILTRPTTQSPPLSNNKSINQTLMSPPRELTSKKHSFVPVKSQTKFEFGDVENLSDDD